MTADIEGCLTEGKTENEKHSVLPGSDDVVSKNPLVSQCFYRNYELFRFWLNYCKLSIIINFVSPDLINVTEYTYATNLKTLTVTVGNQVVKHTNTGEGGANEKSGDDVSAGLSKKTSGSNKVVGSGKKRKKLSDKRKKNKKKRRQVEKQKSDDEESPYAPSDDSDEKGNTENTKVETVSKCRTEVGKAATEINKEEGPQLSAESETEEISE